MANFQMSPADKNARFDAASGRLIMMLGETTKIDLFGVSPSGGALEVDVNDMATAAVTPVGSTGQTFTYAITANKVGNVMLEARAFDNCPTSDVRRQQWFSKPCCAFILVSVMGSDFMQSGGTWGNLKYGSTNPAWKNVQWSTMAYAGCGPTSLAIILDYLFRLSGSVGISPLETMTYASVHGRAAGPDDSGAIVGKGTSADEMLSHLGSQWPGYAAEQILSVDTAVIWLKAGTPLIFLANNSVSTWKEPKSDPTNVHRWPEGHYMVLLGVENGDDNASQVFWISDPSLARTKYTSRTDLQSARMWRVYSVAP